MRLLVVQTAPLGDVVLTEPLLRELRRAGSQVTLLARPPVAELFVACGAVDAALAYDKPRRRPGLIGIWRLARALRAKSFDAALAAQRSQRSGALLRLARIPQRVGFADAPGAWAYTSRVSRRLELHAARRYLALAAPFGGDLSTADAMPRLTPTDEALRHGRRLLLAAGIGTRYAVLAPGSARRTKRWPAERFAEVSAALRRGGLPTVVVGGRDETQAGATVAAGGGAADLTGRTTLGELLAVLAEASIVIGNDSATGHLAAAAGAPLLTLFGPTAPQLGYAPLGTRTAVAEVAGLDCRPCHHTGPRRCPLGHFRCMLELDPASVLRAAEGLLASGS